MEDENDLKASSLRNTDLHASVTELEGQVRRLNEDVKCILLSSITMVMEKWFVESFFYEANRALHTVCVIYGRRQGCKIMNTKHALGLAAPEIPLFNLPCFQRIEDEFSSFFCGDYLAMLGFPFRTIDKLRCLLSVLK